MNHIIFIINWELIKFSILMLKNAHFPDELTHQEKCKIFFYISSCHSLDLKHEIRKGIQIYSYLKNNF